MEKDIIKYYIAIVKNNGCHALCSCDNCPVSYCKKYCKNDDETWIKVLDHCNKKISIYKRKLDKWKKI